MNFVTVTCSTDFDAMLLQASSLEFVIDNIIHFVIIQDSKIELKQWKSALSPYYNRHVLVLIQNDLTLRCDGWRQQQILKLEIAKKINTKNYLVLDSKNFFIKPFNLTDWDVPHGNGSLFLYYKNNKKRIDIDIFLEKVCKKFNKEIPKLHIDYMTPYKLNTGIVNTIIDTDYQSLFFEYELQSEFALYNMFLPNSEIIKCNKGKNQLVLNYFKALPTEIHKTTFVLGIHRRLIIEENKNTLNNLIEVLSSKGLDKQLLSKYLGV
jgi:hypothetical protein